MKNKPVSSIYPELVEGRRPYLQQGADTCRVTKIIYFVTLFTFWTSDVPKLFQSFIIWGGEKLVEIS